jgi:hypothetical protein
MSRKNILLLRWSQYLPLVVSAAHLVVVVDFVSRQ